MTMSVEIKNTDTRPVPNAVALIRDGRVMNILNPGESATQVYIWDDGGEITLKEVPLREIKDAEPRTI